MLADIPCVLCADMANLCVKGTWMPKNSLLKLSRQVHLYFGLLISPALLFFAFTGCYQTLGLHEPSSNYKPSAFLASLGQIHKKQTYIVPVRRANNGPEVSRSQSPRASNPEPDTRPEGGQDSTGSHRHRAEQGDHAGPKPTGQPSPGPEGAQRAGQAPDPAGRPSTPSPAASGPGQQAPTLQAKQKQHLPLKIFFVIVSLGLFTSTLTGIYMAYKFDRNTVLVTALLLAGVIIPVVLLRF